MKQPVKYSTYCIIVTIITAIAIASACVYTYRQDSIIPFWIVAVASVSIIVGALIYAPLSVEVTDSQIKIHRPLRAKTIELSQIESMHLSLCPPTMAAIRICGSGGWFGYWGWFREQDLGKYFAYYGKASDCFLITLRGGRKYIIGCSNPQSVISQIKTLLSQRA